MGQVSLPNIPQPIVPTNEPETMSKVWTFDNEEEANRLF